ncbi:MAG: hypothetical protein U9P14_03305 [Gemmatimonadota bacterium]|nr:hypothetical protein [Gemmatimonadota bacterium]
MKKSTVIMVTALFLLAVYTCEARSGGPVLEGFPWPDPANGTICEVPTVLGKIEIDGSLAEKGWAAAAVIDEFYRAEDAGHSRAGARASVLFDGRNLVISLDLPELTSGDTLEKSFLSDEYNLVRSGGPRVSISLDPTHGHGVYYQFVVGPEGQRQDLRVSDESWSSDWSAAAGSAGGRWQAEISVPVSEISEAPRGGDIWGFNIALYGLEGEGALSSTPIRLDLVDAGRFGHILFKGDLSAGSLAGIKSSLPRMHSEQKQEKLAANQAMCGPEMEKIPGELEGLAPGRQLTLAGGMKITCLGLDNQQVVRSGYPFFYEKYENSDLQRLRKLYSLDEVIAPGRNEFEKILLLNEWLVEHVPFGRPAPIAPQALHVLEHGLTGQTFFCTYLSFALMQMYTSLGWTARKITSVGHGTLDLWSNYWRKWIQIDPSRNSYFRLRGTAVPLNSNEIRRQYWRNGGVDMEMVFGTEQRVEGVTLQKRDKDGLLRYRQDGYGWVAYKTRNNFFEVPYAYRNFLYLMIEDEYNRGKKWIHMYSGKPDQRQLFSLQTDREGDIFWTLNQAFIHLYDNSSNGEKELKVQLETVTPNFESFEISIDNGQWRQSGPVFTWALHPGQNLLNARSINMWGMQGREHKVVLLVE